MAMEFLSGNNEQVKAKAEALLTVAKSTLATDIYSLAHERKPALGKKRELVDRKDETSVTSVSVAIYDQDNTHDLEHAIGTVVRDPGPFFGHLEFSRTTEGQYGVGGMVYFRGDELPILVVSAKFDGVHRLDDDSRQCATLMTELGLADAWLDVLYDPHPIPSIQRQLSNIETTGLTDFLGQFAVTS